MGRRPDDVYLRTTWFEDRDVTLRRHSLRMVTTRKPHQCAGNGSGEEHEIPPGTRALYESAIMDDEPVQCWLCVACMDAWLDDLDEPVEGGAPARCGTCCGCGYSGEAETPCPKRADGSHCNHWWDGPDETDAAPEPAKAQEVDR